MLRATPMRRTSLAAALALSSLAALGCASAPDDPAPPAGPVARMIAAAAEATTCPPI